MPVGTDQAIDDVLRALSASAGAAYIGEQVSQLEHALQAAHFARHANAPDEAVLAALLHDIGHLIAPAGAPQMDGLGVIDHEELGARYLSERGFSDTVAELVRGHVQAKRYLAFKHAAYGQRLSEASRRTLEFQGGPMADSEARAFESDALFKQKVQVRGFDEAGKRVDLAVEPLEFYRAMIERHLVR
jgi:putative nucleotidyltransferase with HDIG domain